MKVFEFKEMSVTVKKKKKKKCKKSLSVFLNAHWSGFVNNLPRPDTSLHKLQNSGNALCEDTRTFAFDIKQIKQP